VRFADFLLCLFLRGFVSGGQQEMDGTSEGSDMYSSWVPLITENDAYSMWTTFCIAAQSSLKEITVPG
jgi:hypothetical protein